jgi:transposase-like protein
VCDRGRVAPARATAGAPAPACSAVAAFRQRPLDAGPYTFVSVDALVVKVREDGRVVNVHALVATGVNADGHREILGLGVASAEAGAVGWRSCAGWLPAGCRGCSW